MRDTSRRFLRALLAAGLIVGAVAIPVAAGTITPATTYVGPGGGSGMCASPAFSTIQAAVSAAAEGGTILVCPGIYREHVSVTTNGLTIKSVWRWSATLKPPAVPPIRPAGESSLITIDGANDVTIYGLRLAAPTAGDCSQVAFLILVIDGATDAVISNNRLVPTGTDTIGACGYGTGIEVEGASTARITHNLVKDFQAVGISVEGPGSYAFIRRNWVRYFHAAETGTGTGGVGIQVGAADFAPINPTAQVRRNMIVGLATAGVSTPQLDVGISVVQTGPGTVVADNVASHAWVGLDLFLDTTGARVLRNQLLDGGYAGIYSDGVVNDFIDNIALGNTTYDCYDSGYPSNTWTGDIGVISQPAALCSAPRQ